MDSQAVLKVKKCDSVTCEVCRLRALHNPLGWPPAPWKHGTNTDIWVGILHSLPNTRMFFPDGNFELDRVETSLSMDDLHNDTWRKKTHNDVRFGPSHSHGAHGLVSISNKIKVDHKSEPKMTLTITYIIRGRCFIVTAMTKESGNDRSSLLTGTLKMDS